MNLKTLLSSVILISIVVLLIACDNSLKIVPVEINPVNTVKSNSFTTDSFAYYESILKKDSLNISLRLALATNYYVDKKYDKTLENLRIVYRIDNKNIQALTGLGNVYYDTEDYLNAVKYYEMELKLDPNNVDVRCDLATCYLNLKKPEVSLSLLKKNISINPGHAQSHHNLSVVYNQLGKTKEAAEEMSVFNSLSK